MEIRVAKTAADKALELIAKTCFGIFQNPERETALVPDRMELLAHGAQKHKVLSDD